MVYSCVVISITDNILVSFSGTCSIIDKYCIMVYFCVVTLITDIMVWSPMVTWKVVNYLWYAPEWWLKWAINIGDMLLCGDFDYLNDKSHVCSCVVTSITDDVSCMIADNDFNEW